MPDIATTWQPATSTADWTPAGADLASGGDLQTAVLISLFTDRIAHTDDVVPDGDPRGWVGDDATPIGSRLWLLRRSTLTQQTLLTAKDMILEALQWLLDDGVASTIDVQTSIGAPRRLDAVITLSRTGGAPIVLQYAWAWGG